MGAAFERQTFCLVLAVAIALMWPRLSFVALVTSYVASTLISGVLLQRAWLGSASAKQRGSILLLLALPSAVQLVRRGPELLEHEGLREVVAQTRQKLELEGEVSLAPRLVSLDRPQTFFVRAAPARDVRVRLAPGLRTLRAETVGRGLYRVDYDPRREGLPGSAQRRQEATLYVGEAAHAVEVSIVKPLAHPRFLCVSRDRTLAAVVSEETDELFWLSSTGLIRRHATADAPTDCVFSGAREVVVSHRYGDELWLLAPESDAPLRRLKLGTMQHRLALSLDGTRIAVARQGASPEIVVIDTASLGVTAHVPMEGEPDWLTFGTDPRTLIVSTRHALSLQKLVEHEGRYIRSALIALSRPVVSMQVSHDRRQLLAAVTDFRQDSKDSLGNHFIQDQLLSIDIDAFQVTSSLHTARRSARQEKPGDFDQGLSPMGIDLRDNGDTFLTFAGSSELWHLSPTRPGPTSIDLTAHGLVAPHGVVVLGDGSVIVSSPARGLLGIFGPDLKLRRLVALAPDDATLRRTDPDALARRLGEWGFYEGTRSGISCQSCHLHADSDGARHNLGGRRLLPTLSVRGLAGTAPFLRDGSSMQIGDLDHVAQTLYRGYLRKAPGRAHTLEAFVSALPRHDNRSLSEARLPAAERRGAQAFEKAGCPTCHAPPLFSALGQFPARSLFPELEQTAADEELDTPSLLSTASVPPYLHDGRAPSLEAVFVAHNRKQRHGHTAILSTDERRDLAHFLESL